MLKQELIAILEELFALGSNHDVSKLSTVRTKLTKFLSDLMSSESSLLDYQNNENAIIAQDFIHLIDAMSIYALKTDRIEAGRHAKPIFSRLTPLELNKWHYYDLKLFTISLDYIEDVEQALELSEKAVSRIADFREIKPVDTLEGALACNLCSRLLYAKFFEDNVKVDVMQSFDLWLHRLEELEERENWKLTLFLLVTQIRKAVLDQDQNKIDELFEKLIEDGYDEDIEQVIKNEVEFYKSSEKYKGGVM